MGYLTDSPKNTVIDRVLYARGKNTYFISSQCSELKS